MLFAASKLWTFCLFFAFIPEVITIVVLDKSASGKPIWRESSKYRDRSQIPRPSELDRSKLNLFRQDFYPAQRTHQTKKWKIGRIFYTMPIGVTFPIFYTSTRSSRKIGKKSEIYSPEGWIWKRGQIVKATVTDRNSKFQND